jgi:hypothetical protein
MNRLLTGAGRLAIVVGAVAWLVGLALFATARPSLDSWLIMVPFGAAMAIGTGVGITTALGPTPFDNALGRVGGSMLGLAGAALIAAQVIGGSLVGVCLLVGTLTFLAGSVVVGIALLRQPSSKLAGGLVAGGTLAFMVALPWALGVSPTGGLLVAQEATEIGVALAIAVGWLLVAARIGTPLGTPLTSPTAIPAP